MSEEMNNGNVGGTDAGNGNWMDKLPAAGNDPFGGDDSDEITLIGGRPEVATEEKSKGNSGGDENNIDFDELLSDNVPTNNEEGGKNAEQAQPQGQQQGQTKDIRAALDDYGMAVVDSIFNAEGFAKQLTESDPNALALTLKKSFSEMYQRCLQDSLLVARRFADDAMKSAVNAQAEQFTAREQAQILKSTLAPYPDLSKAVYRPVVKTVYEKALAKGKSPQEAANLVVAYFRKNIPNAIQEPAQAKQTDGRSINDIWANFR